MKLKNLKLIFAFLLLSLTSYANENIVNISINNISEDSGLELGDNSRARGAGSITTGKNSIALGLNAAATGGDENKESIERKLNENKEKLNEIENAKRLINDKTNELSAKQLRERATIEAGIRVEEIKKAKEKAKQKWEEAIETYNKEKLASKDFLAEQMSKINNLNSRLTGLSKIPSVNISSEEGLKKAAIELKSIAEEGTDLNLSIDFYKDYVDSYYKALGDLRKNYQSYEYFIRDGDYGENSDIFNVLEKSTLNRQKDEVNGYFMEDNGIENLRGLREILLDNTFAGKNNKYINFINSYESSYFSNLKKDELFSNSVFYNDGEVITDIQFRNWNQNKNNAKEKYVEYSSNIGNGLLNLGDIPNSREYIMYIYNRKFELADLSQKAKYYQWEYERTKDTTWLDKKKESLDKYNQIIAVYATENKTEVEKVFSNVDGYRKGDTLMDLMKNNILAWGKVNITDIKNINKITVETLTNELEQALGINKKAILEKENELNNLKKKAEQNKINYEAINPSESDLILAREYVKVKKEIDQISTEIIQANDRLKALKEALTLHNLANLGENQIAIGTNSLVAKNNSIAIGTRSISIGEDSISLGKENLILGDRSLALGNDNTIYGNNNIILGNGNRVGKDKNTKSNVYILGENIDATGISNAIVLGANSTAIENALSVGNNTNLRKIVNVADGEISTTSNEVITGKQLKNAIDSIVMPEVDLSNFYNKNETNILLDKKLDKSVYNNDISKINSEINKKANRNDVYTKSEISTLLNTKIDITNIENALTSYVKLDGSNIDEKSKINLTEKLNENSNLKNPTNTLITDTKIKNFLDENYYTNIEIDKKIDNLNIELNEKVIEKENLSKNLIDEIENKADKDGRNILNEDKIKFRENIEVYSKLEVDNKLSNIEINANGIITENEENAVKGKTVYKYLTNNYITKQELNIRDEAIINNYNKIQENKKAIIFNTEKIRQVEKKVNRTAALSSAMSAIEFSKVNTGELSIGAGISSFSEEQGIAIGLMYSPIENLLLGLKYAGLADDRYRGAIGGTVSYKFRLHN